MSHNKQIVEFDRYGIKAQVPTLFEMCLKRIHSEIRNNQKQPNNPDKPVAPMKILYSNYELLFGLNKDEIFRLLSPMSTTQLEEIQKIYRERIVDKKGRKMKGFEEGVDLLWKLKVEAEFEVYNSKGKEEKQTWRQYFEVFFVFFSIL